MTPADAVTLVAKLFAAYPFHRDNDKLTTGIYAMHVGELHDPALANDAIDALIRGTKFLPSVFEIREAYAVERERMVRASQARALNEAPLMDEERAEYGRIAREYLATLDRRSAVLRVDDVADIEEKRRRALSL